MDDVEQRVFAVIRETFGLPAATPLSRDMTAADVDGWDSLNHTTLLIMLERRLGVSISDGEANELPDVGALIDLAKSKSKR
jgi:acyl carrier protein